MGKPTEEELELLTDEEREALEIDENETSEEEEPAEEAPAEAETEEPTEEEPPEEENPAEEETAEETAEDAPEVPEPEIKVDFRPKVDNALPDTIKQQIEAKAKELNADIEKQLADLKEQYDEGDLETADYVEQTSALRDQMQENRLDVRDTLRSEWREQQITQQRWEAEQDAFFKLNPQYDAPRYSDKGELEAGNPVLYGALDAACQSIARQNPGLSGVDLLMEAKKQVDAAMGKAPEKPNTSGKPAAQRPKNTNLGDLPAAHQDDAGQGQFTHLDKLSGDKLEEELAKLPVEQRERYLAGA